MMEVALPKTTLVAEAPPTVTVAPLTKPVPVLVTVFPPIVAPWFSDMPVTVGAGGPAASKLAVIE